jgi:hypothetical protein
MEPFAAPTLNALIEMAEARLGRPGAILAGIFLALLMIAGIV